MLSVLPAYGEAVTLIPHSGVQFVDYGFDERETKHVSRSFIERITSIGHDGTDANQTLLPNWDEDDPSAEPPLEVLDEDDTYTAGSQAALRLFAGEWLPVPFLKIRRGTSDTAERYHDGPFDWARMRITETRKAFGDTAASHRVVFAFDTALRDTVKGRQYLALSNDDAARQESFRFVHRPSDIASFLSSLATDVGEGQKPVDHQAWLLEWLRRVFLDAKAREKGRALREEDVPHSFEHVALYMALLEYVAKAASPRRVTLANTVAEDGGATPVEVDLVLDVGNSRTCGLLVPTFPSERSVDLSRSLVLELRDLSLPVLSYDRPFESHVELANAEFGAESLAKRSGRSRAFFWPSLVRIGPEAARYRSESEGTEAMTGLSSPKRYLWDIDPVLQPWRVRGLAHRDAQPLVERSLYRYVNSRGDVLDQLRADRKAMNLKVKPEDFEQADALKFSRSSFFTFMLLEIIAQAMRQMNSVSARTDNLEPDAPRVLRSVVLTVPSAMPVQEQRIVRSRAESALRLYWSLMAWTEGGPGIPARPRIHAAFDEASSMHLVYLYGEINEKLGGSISTLLNLVGRPRTGKPPNALARIDEDEANRPERSLRIASIDIGGGTTDLMITTYFDYNDRALVPVQNFREGFRRAGDDLLKAVVERVVLRSIQASLEDRGVANAETLLRGRFDNSPGMSEAAKHLRRQFVQRFLKPVALGILADAETTPPDGALGERAFAEFFDDAERVFHASNPILSFLDGFIAETAVSDWRLADVIVRADLHQLDECIQATFRQIFDNIADAVHEFQPDVVLLTGRPSCLPGVVRQFCETQPVSVDRIVATKNLRVGPWYPFRPQGQNVIGDPKTTAAVGGMLCSLAADQLTNFTLLTDNLQMRSTARFVGEMRKDGVIEGGSVYFADIDLDEDEPTPMEAQIEYYSPIQIGYRQLQREDWVASPLYRLRVTGENRSLKRPIAISLERQTAELSDDPDTLEILNSEATREEFVSTSAEDANGQRVDRLVQLRFDTSPPGSDGTYWLDSGIVSP